MTATTKLDDFARVKLARLQAASLTRQTIPTIRDPEAGVTRDGRRLISFSCNDYLNLSHHPEVKARARDTIP